MRHADIYEKALTQPHTFIFVGPQKRDLNDICELILMGHYDLRLLMKPMDRPDGVDWMQVVDTGESDTDGKSWQEVITRSLANQKGISGGVDISHGDNWKEGHRTGRKKGFSENESEDESGGMSENSEGLLTYNKSDRRGRGKGKSLGFEEGESSDIGGSTGITFKRGNQQSTTEANSNAIAKGGNKSKTRSKNTKWVHLPRYREEWYPAGLEIPKEVQELIVKGVLRRLKQREVVISHAENAPVKARVHFVAEAWEGRPLRRSYEMQKLQEKLEAWHGFYFEPTGVEKWRSQRIENKSSNGQAIRKRWE